MSAASSAGVVRRVRYPRRPAVGHGEVPSAARPRSLLAPGEVGSTAVREERVGRDSRPRCPARTGGLGVQLVHGPRAICSPTASRPGLPAPGSTPSPRWPWRRCSVEDWSAPVAPLPGSYRSRRSLGRRDAPVVLDQRGGGAGRSVGASVATYRVKSVAQVLISSEPSWARLREAEPASLGPKPGPPRRRWARSTIAADAAIAAALWRRRTARNRPWRPR